MGVSTAASTLRPSKGAGPASSEITAPSRLVFDHGADVAVHSATKYFGGNGTTMGGVIVDSGRFDWTAHAERYPNLTGPDHAYHETVWTDAAGPAAYIIRARTERIEAERQKRQAEEDEKNRKIHDAFVSRMTSKVQADEMVCGEDLLEFARHVGIEVHPRTAGSLKRRIVAVNSGQCRFHGERPPATVYELYRQVRGKLQPVAV